MTANRQALIAVLGKIQNSAKFQNIDIMTYAGWRGVTDADVQAHVMSYFVRLGKKRQAEVLAFVREMQAKSLAA